MYDVLHVQDKTDDASRVTRAGGVGCLFRDYARKDKSVAMKLGAETRHIKAKRAFVHRSLSVLSASNARKAKLKKPRQE